MSRAQDPRTSPLSRRTFLGGSAALAGASLLTGTSFARDRRAAGDRTLRVALVGCGGRGTGAAAQALATAGAVELVAVADAFSDRLESCLAWLREHRGDRVQVPPERRFVGFDAYERAIDALDGAVDVVILTTPPGFRPKHFEYAVARGKHVFMEKPVAVDGPGVRIVLAAAERARAQELKVGVGLQRHHQARYQEGIRRIRDGAIGEPLLLRCYWNSGGVWVHPRQPGWSEMEYQMRNWYYFNWLCGDHIVEQHIHNLDVCNWVMDGYPVRAQGQGGRQVRTGPDHGEIYDHHMVEYTFASGARMLSQCRHIEGTWSSVSEHAHGTAGTADLSAGRIDGRGGESASWRFRGEEADPFQVEHDVLFAAIRSGAPHMEAENGAHSTLTAVMGRMATYSGKVVGWEEALNSELALVPSAYAFDADPPTLPGPDGRYAIPTPGLTRAV